MYGCFNDKNAPPGVTGQFTWDHDVSCCRPVYSPSDTTALQACDVWASKECIGLLPARMPANGPHHPTSTSPRHHSEPTQPSRLDVPAQTTPLTAATALSSGNAGSPPSVAPKTLLEGQLWGGQHHRFSQPAFSPEKAGGVRSSVPRRAWCSAGRKRPVEIR